MAKGTTSEPGPEQPWYGQLAIPWLRLYVSLTIGRDRRAGPPPPEFAEKRRPTSRRDQLLMLGAAGWIVFGGLFLAVCSAYVVKSRLGINLFEGHPFTDALEAIGLCKSYGAAP